MSETLVWRKSSFCAQSACVEVARTRRSVLVRDTKDPGGPILGFSRADWAAFVAALGAGLDAGLDAGA